MANVTDILDMAAKLGLHNLAKREFQIKEEGIPNLEFLEWVFSKELECREAKRREKAKFYSRLPSGFTLDSYDFNFNSCITNKQLEKLLTFNWINERYNLIILGGAGSGKTHLAAGIGNKAVDSGYKTFYVTLQDFLYLIKTKDSISKSKSRLSYMKECELVIFDEIGYMPLAREDALEFYNIINEIYKRTALILITNRDFTKWGEIFHDEVIATTLLDRLTQNCQLINLKGDSYRLATHKKIFTK